MSGIQCFPRAVGSSVWEPIAWDALGQIAAALADRANMSNGAVEPFADSGDVTLTNATVSGGYCANTISLAGTWTAGVAVPAATVSGLSFELNGFIYASAAATAATIVRMSKASYMDGTGSWSAHNGNFPATFLGMSALVHDGYIYILGGTDTSSTWATNILRKSVTDFEAGTGMWSSHGSLPVGVAGCSCVIVGDYVYLFGGGDSTGSYNTSIYRETVANLVAGTSSWGTHGTLPSGLYGGSCCICGDRVFLVGGYASYPPAVLNTVNRYKLVTDLQDNTGSWISTGSLPQAGGMRATGFLMDGIFWINSGGGSGGTITTTYKQQVSYAATITLNPISVSGATAGKIVFRASNEEAAAILDVVNKIGVYPMINGAQGTQLTFTSEDMGGGVHRFTSADFSLTSATTFGARFASLVANNFKIYDAYFLWR